MAQIQNKFIANNAVTTSKIDNGAVTNDKVATGIDASKLGDGSVTNTEFQRLNGITGDIQTQLDAKVDESREGVANGIATLDAGGKVPVSQLPSAVMTYEGVWNANTNSPALADGAGDAGMVYRVGTAGTQDLGSGSITFDVGDYVIYNGTTWEKSDTTDAVASVNGQTGIVTLDTDDIAEGANLYFTDERAQDAVGNNLLDTASVDLTYNDGTGQISAAVLPAGVDHDSLNNFVANEHIDHSTVNIATGANSGLAGGGNITATRNIILDVNNLSTITPDASDTLPIYDVSGTVTGKATVSSIAATTSANRALSNLTATSVNLDVNPGTTNSIDLGSSTNVWRSLYIGTQSRFYELATGNQFGLIQGATLSTVNHVDQAKFTIQNTAANATRSQNSLGLFTPGQAASTPSGNVIIATGQVNSGTGTEATGEVKISTGRQNVGTGTGASGAITINSGATAAGGGASGIVSLLSGDTTTGNSGNTLISTGNSTSANSGNIILTTGTAGGTRGDIRFVDGTQGTVGHVWTSVDVNGSGSWQAPAAEYTDEQAQDAVGNILTDSASIDFTYNDGANTITAAVLPAGVDHDALNNFVANEHVDHTSVNIATSATSGLTGGGDISATRNISVQPDNATLVTAASGDLILVADVSDSNNLKKVTAQTIADLAVLPINDKKDITLVAGDITNQYVDLDFVARTDSINMSISGIMQVQGSDYTVNYTGGAGGVTRITFAGDLATGGASELVATDILNFQYEH